MPHITIYTRPGCGYCAAAKALLNKKGATYEEINIWEKPGAREEMVERSGGGSTVPQIFIGERHVGGSDELHALDRSGGLDPLLANDA
jgi:glutaredoxin 3